MKRESIIKLILNRALNNLGYLFDFENTTEKEFNQNINYIIRLKNYNNCMEYCLVDRNDENNIYAVFEEEPINN